MYVCEICVSQREFYPSHCEPYVPQKGFSMITKISIPTVAAPLFKDWEETLIWSCLQGTMGEIYADDNDTPSSAMAILGDFCFFAGIPNKELLLYKPSWFTQDFIIMVPQNDSWSEMIECCYLEKAKKVTRYAFKKEPDVFDRNRLLEAIASLPQEYSLQMIDHNLFHKCRSLDWSRDLISQFPDYEAFHASGLGVVILKDGEPVCGASSYSRYTEGIEIEIDTHEPYRRKGLAYICGAKLILKCLERNLYPSWDAQNTWSKSLAGKLGYQYSHDYTAYEIWGY